MIGTSLHSLSPWLCFGRSYYLEREKGQGIPQDYGIVSAIGAVALVVIVIKIIVAGF